MLFPVSATRLNVAAELRPAADAASRAASGEGRTARLTDTEQVLLRKLQETDRIVRAHELAHIAAGQGLVRGGASFSYVRGPDGRNYAVGGEVQIDSGPGRTPAETLVKARAIERAALAPVDPSAQDRRVAALAARLAADASMELRVQQRGETSGAAATAFYQQVQGDDGAAVAGLQAFA